MTRKAPLIKARTLKTRIKISRALDIFVFRQKVSIRASGPPYIAGETIIATARASDSMAKQTLAQSYF
jgi:hypothetical protein